MATSSRRRAGLLRPAFEQSFGPASEARLFRAPGRVNLIGEHVDYNGGFVLPMAIDRETVVLARPREDRTVRARAVRFDERATFSLDELAPDHSRTWKEYVRGTAWTLETKGFRLTGADLVIDGDVPLSAGLSSSASVEVACAWAFLSLAGLRADRPELALLCQRAENQFVGVQCGIMDQFVIANARAGHALLLDCRDLSFEHVPIPDRVAVVVADSGVPRNLAASAYNRRRQECDEAARRLGVTSLRDVDVDTFRRREGELPEPLRRRARHVVTEIARTVAASEAFRAGDLRRTGELMNESHASLRDDYEVSSEELNVLVELAAGVEGVYGARLTGAGFGGCIVALADRAAVGRVTAALEQGYPRRTGKQVTVYDCRPAAGVGEVPRTED